MTSELLGIVQDLGAELWEVGPYFGFGVLLEAWIRTKKWHLKIRRVLGRLGYASILVATVLGLLSPLCACGVLPITVSLVLAGLPLGPAMSLLVTSPLMSPAGYALSVKNLGLAWANAEVAAAVFMGLYAGVLAQWAQTRGLRPIELFRKPLPPGDFHDQDYPEELLRCHCNDMLSKRVEARTTNPVLVFLAKAWEGGIKVGKYVLIGLVFEVLARRYVPFWIEPLLTSSDPLAVAGITLAAVPLHINQITASSILFGFNDVPVSRAAAMALLIGGPVTAIPAMVVFLTLFKPKLFFLYLTICVSGTLIAATAFQAFGG